MQIKIKNVEGKELTVDMRHPTGREVKKVRKELISIQEKAEKDGEIKGLINYLDFLDNIALECVTLDGKKISIDFLDDLPQDQKEKITSIVSIDAFGELDFTKLFGKPPS